jgi:cell wall-associated NlpC family hydrolase
MTEGLAAVQSRMLEIQSRFAAPTGRFTFAPAAGAARSSVAAAMTAGAPSDRLSTSSSFSNVLASSQAQLAAPASPAARAAGAGRAGVTGDMLVAKAQEQLGVPYVWGGESLAEGGFDCSGLLQWTYKQFGIDIPRVSRDQATAGRAVSAAEARPGDLVFFKRDRPAPDHIGMYAGDGQWVVAPKTGDVVKMQKVDLSKATTIRRILPDDAAAPALATAAVAAPAVAGPAPTAATSRGEAAFTPLFQSAGQRHGVSPALLTAVARAESAFNPAARSPAGAQGLMQFMPATAADLGIDPWKPEEAVDGAARLLKSHLARFGSTELALAAYNAGPGAVTKHGGIPPYKETQNYVRKIMSELKGVAA